MIDEDKLPAEQAGGKVQPAPTNDDVAPSDGAEEQPEPSEEAPEPTESDEGGEETEEQERQKRLSGSQKSKRKIERLEAELEETRARLALAARPEARPRTVEERIGPPPNPQNYQGNPNAYWAAVAGYEARRGVAEQTMQEEARQAEARETVRLERLAESYRAKQDEGRAKIPDFDAVVLAKPLEVKPHVGELLVESDMTAELEYHLAKNPEKLAQLNKMTERLAAKEIGRLETLLSGPAQTKSTQAPSPIKPLKGGSAGPALTLAEAAKRGDMELYNKLRAAGRTR